MRKLMMGLAFLLLLVITACGNNENANNNDKDQGQNENQSEEQNQNEANEQITLRVAGGSVGPEHSLTKTFNYLKDKLEEDSNGKFKVDLNVSGELGEDREIIEAMQMGDIHLASPSPAALGAFNKSIQILDMPFLFTNRETAYEVLDGEPGKKSLDLLEESGLKGLGYFENGFRNLTNDVKPIESLEDLKGLSIRTQENESHLRAWELLGANPTPMSLGELYTALQQGTVDGQENPFGLIVANKFYEVQKYLTVTNHVYAPNVIITNKEFYEDLPDDLKEVFADSIKEAVSYNRKLAQEEAEEGQGELEELGMEIYEFTDEQMAEMQEVTQEVYEEFRDEIGGDIVDMYLEVSQ